jgi:hypothetical protein
MVERVVLLSIPQVRRRDVTPGALSSLDRLCASGSIGQLVPSFPSVSAPAFATLVTGTEAGEHGMVASAYYDRELCKVVGPYLDDSAVTAEKLWESVARGRPGARTMAWFGPNTRGASVDFWAEIDEDGRLRTKPLELAEELVKRLGPFPSPLGGPAAAAPRFETTAWVVRSAAYMIGSERPDFAVVRIPHLGHVARRFGPDSREASRAIMELDRLLGPVLPSIAKDSLVVAASESIATPVSEPVDVNRILRSLDALHLQDLAEGGTDIDCLRSPALAVADHQVCHVYVNHPDRLPELASAFSGNQSDGIEIVLQGASRKRLGLGHERSGDLVLVAEPDRWFRGDWWLNPKEAPKIRRCPSGLDSASLHLVSDPARVQGSMGAPVACLQDAGMVAASQRGFFASREVISQTDVAYLLRNAL